MSNELKNYDFPIPKGVGEAEGWRTKPIKESNNPLVPIGLWSDYPEIFTSSIYAGELKNSPFLDSPLDGSSITIFARKAVADRLKVAQLALPNNIWFIAHDIYRPSKVQSSLYAPFHQENRLKHPDWAEEDVIKDTQNYVSIPSEDPQKPSPHLTGGAVDVTLFTLPESVSKEVKRIETEIDKMLAPQELEAYPLWMSRFSFIKDNIIDLDFGVPFDHGKEAAWLRYFENIREEFGEEKSLEIRKNRRLLYWSMAHAGFQSFKSEYWHFNYGNQMAAQAAAEDYAIFGKATLGLENLAFEQMRQKHREGNIKMHSGVAPFGKLVDPGSVTFVAWKVAQEVDYPRTSLAMAEKISPLTL